MPDKMRTRQITPLLALLLLTAGCSVRQYALRRVGDMLAGSGTTFASDNDPELVRDAAPFSLKLMESVLAETPEHPDLLLETSKSFTQYAYAFVHQEADEMESENLRDSLRLRGRARKLYLRALEYGLRGLDVNHPGLAEDLRADAQAAVRRARARDVPLLYWAAAAWGQAIALSKDHPDLIADVPIVAALIDRALELNEAYEDGAIHSFLITFEMARPGGQAGAADRSRRHFERAVELSRGQLATPFVAYAEQVCVQEQDRGQFEELLRRALAVDPDQRPEQRLENLVAQRRAQWLLGRVEELFLE